MATHTHKKLTEVLKGRGGKTGKSYLKQFVVRFRKDQNIHYF